MEFGDTSKEIRDNPLQECTQRTTYVLSRKEGWRLLPSIFGESGNNARVLVYLRGERRHIM
jgi:hypothetical protein